MTATALRLCPVCGGPNNRSMAALYCSTRCQQRSVRKVLNSSQLFIRRQKEGRPCTDCGITWPYYVMQFDHVPGRGQKLFMLSQSHGHGQEAIMHEIAKCDLVCANCHLIRTQARATKRPGMTVRLVAIEEVPPE